MKSSTCLSWVEASATLLLCICWLPCPSGKVTLTDPPLAGNACLSLAVTPQETPHHTLFVVKKSLMGRFFLVIFLIIGDLHGLF